MIKVNDKVKCTAAGSMQRNTIFKVLEVSTDEWMGESIKSYTLTDGIVKFTVTEDTVYKS